MGVNRQKGVGGGAHTCALQAPPRALGFPLRTGMPCCHSLPPPPLVPMACLSALGAGAVPHLPPPVNSGGAVGRVKAQFSSVQEYRATSCGRGGGRGREGDGGGQGEGPALFSPGIQGHILCGGVKGDVGCGRVAGQVTG